MIDKRPRLIARCADVADVLAAVTYGRENKLLTAIRGGGHNGGGLGTCDDGLVIDLSLMKGTRVDPKARCSSISTIDRGAVHVRFNRAPSREVDLVVGADGLHSRIRQRCVVTRLLRVPPVADFFIGRDLRDDFVLPDLGPSIDRDHIDRYGRSAYPAAALTDTIDIGVRSRWQCGAIRVVKSKGGTTCRFS